MSEKGLVYFTIMATVMVTLLVFLLPGLAEEASSAPAAKNASILIEFQAFSPSNLTIEKGTTVTWLNTDHDFHKIKGDKFESNNLTRGDTFSYLFDKAGTYDYMDALNPSVKGKIIVT